MLDTHGVTAKHRVELLRDTYASNALFAAEFPSGDFRSRVETWALPGLAVTTQTSDANKIFLTGGKSFSAPDLVYVRINLEGANRAFFDGRSYLARAGDISILDSRGVGVTDFTKRRTLAIYMPRDVVAAPSCSQLPDLIRGTSPAGRLLGSALREFDRALPETPAELAGSLSAGLSQVIRALLDGTRPDLNREDLAQARRRAVVDYIDSHMALLNIDARHLCARFGVSRATLYRMFRDDGGVENFVRERRLFRVYQDLATAENRRGAVTRIAERWGFYDPSKFANQFRRVFGVRPSDALASERAPTLHAPRTDPAASDSRFNELMRGLS